MNNLEKKWKGLLHKVGYLKVELEDRKEKLSKFESEMGGKLYEKAPDLSPIPAPTHESDDSQKNDEKKEEQEIDGDNEEQIKDEEDTTEADIVQPEVLTVEVFKKLWKQIALKTHPDKNGGDPELTEAYKTALEAWNKGEIETLIDVAAELNIKIQDPSPEMMDALEKRAFQMEEEIKKHESNMLWAWGHAAEDKQSLIVDELLRYKRKKHRA